VCEKATRNLSKFLYRICLSYFDAAYVLWYHTQTQRRFTARLHVVTNQKIAIELLNMALKESDMKLWSGGICHRTWTSGQLLWTQWWSF